MTDKKFSIAEAGRIADQIMKEKQVLNKMREFRIKFEAPQFTPYLIKNGGCLPDDRDCHALFFYAIYARKLYEDKYLGREIQYEGEAEVPPDFPRKFKTAAMIYGADPERMIRFWPEVEAQFEAASIPQVPEFLRFNKVPEIGKEEQH